MPLRFLTLLLLPFLPVMVLSQNRVLDSLLGKWQQQQTEGKTPDSNTVILLNQITREYAALGNDNRLSFATKALELAKKLQYTRGEALAGTNIAKYHYRKGNYDQALKYILESLNVARKLNDAEEIANASNMLGLIYMTQNKQKDALPVFMDAAIVNQRLNNTNRLSANYFNIALCYLDLKMGDSAFAYLQRSKALSTASGDGNMLTMANNRIADYYYKQGETDKAISIYQSVIRANGFQDIWETSFAYTGLAECYYAQQQYETAVSNGLKGFELARQAGTKWDVERVLSILHKAYQATGNTAKAYEYLLLDKLYSDSLQNEAKEKEMNGLYLKQQQAENQILQKEYQLAKDKQAASRMVIVIVILVALFLSALLLILFVNNSKTKRLYSNLQQQAQQILAQKQEIEEKNQSLQQLNQTKDYLFSVVGHDLRSPFALILAAKELYKSGDLNENETREVFTRFFDEITAIYALLENLLLWANSQQTGIQVNPGTVDLHEATAEVLAVFSKVAAKKNIVIEHNSNEVSAVYADADQLRIILQNIITNAIKFTRPDGKIVISYHTREHGVTLSIKDNGIGMSSEKLERLFLDAGKNISTYGTRKEKGLGIGLLLVEKFATLNNISLSVTSIKEEGTTFSLLFHTPA